MREEPNLRTLLLPELGNPLQAAEAPHDPPKDHTRSLRISVFAGKFSANRSYSQVAQVTEAAAVAAQRGTTLLVLPGYSFGRAPITGDRVQALAEATGLAILAEVEHTALFRPGHPPRHLVEQLFKSGAEADNRPHHVRQVLDAIQHADGPRRIDLGGWHIAVLLCGESSILRNRAGQYPEPRFPGMVWPFTYDVLINPAHSTMKRWRELHHTFAYFSQGGRTLIYTTNQGHPNDKHPRRAWGATLRVYQDGHLVATGDRAFVATAGLWQDLSPASDWRMLTLDIEKPEQTREPNLST